MTTFETHYIRPCATGGALLLCAWLASCGQEPPRNPTSPARAPAAQLSSAASSPKPPLAAPIPPPLSGAGDLVPIHGDTLLAVTMYQGIALTTDAGKHWTQRPPRRSPALLGLKYSWVGQRFAPVLNTVTMDHYGVLWGLAWGNAPHSQPYSRLSYSTDFGETWSYYQSLPTDTFLLYRFYSRPGQPVQALTYQTGKLYQLQDRRGKRWTYIRTIAELDADQDTIAGASYFAGAQFKFLDTGQLFSRTKKGWHPVASVDFINEIDDVCSCQGSIFLTGRDRNSGEASLSLVQITNGHVGDSIQTKEVSLALRCDSKDRLWLFSNFGVWQKSGHKLNKLFLLNPSSVPTTKTQASPTK